MADRVLPAPMAESANRNNAVSVQAKKIFDSCKDKDCVEDLRVYPTVSSEQIIQSALSIKPKSAEIISIDISVDEIAFNRGNYTIDVRYYYKITGVCSPGSIEVSGLAVFDKRVILYGSEAGAKVFTSDDFGLCPVATTPTGVVEAVDPIALYMRIVDPRLCPILDNEIYDAPPCVLAAFGEPLDFAGIGKRIYVSVGQFSIISLVRDTQLLVYAYNYSVPEKECQGACEDDPCTLFGKIPFPVGEFYPPDDIGNV